MTTVPPHTATVRVAAPSGLRWATGGGSIYGGCNGLHLAQKGRTGTLCGQIGPATPLDPEQGERICGNCSRIAKVPRIVGEGGGTV